MKQLDLIVSIVALVLAGVAAGVFMGTAKRPQNAPSAPSVATAPVQVPVPPVAKATSLPGGATTAKGQVQRSGRVGGSKLAMGG